jgi:hypothetical protein
MSNDDDITATVPPFLKGMLGWNVYYGTNEFAFVLNEEVLGPAARDFADEVAASLEDG